MAVTKIKAYTTEKAIENALHYTTNKDKTSLLDMDRYEGSPDNKMNNAIKYSENDLKTTYVDEDGHTEVLVSPYRCKLDLAEETFKRTADIYHQNGHNEYAGKHYKKKVLLRAKLDSNGQPILDSAGNMIHDEKSPVYHDENGDTVTFTVDKSTHERSCYMWVMAYPPEEVCGYKIDPRLIHRIGLEFMAELEKETGLEFPAVVSTHMNTHHPHNHIMMSAYSLDGHHKYVDTLASLMKAREISDRLSLKYDLPIIMEPEQGHSMNWNEWKLAKEGKSWKDDMRQQISFALDHSGSYREFIKMMQSAGYKIRETENHLTYYYPENKHRCRDVGLGESYTKEAIEKYFAEPEQEKNQEKEMVYAVDPTLASDQPIKIFVARYTANGRRRSDLEMLLLKAIKLIQYFKDKFSDVNNTDNPVHKSYNYKIDHLQKAIDDLNAYGITSLTELDTRLNNIGARYSHAKKDAADLGQNKDALKQLSDMLDMAAELQTIMESLGIEDPCIQSPKTRDIAKNRAAFFPMTATQRRELYIALQDHPMYRLSSKYDEITYTEAKQCIEYLKTGSVECPKQLSTQADTQTHNPAAKYQTVAEKYLSTLQSRYGDMPVPEKLKQTLKSLDLPVDIDKLSMAEGIHLASYYKPWKQDNKPCGMEDIPVPEGKAKEIKELLELTGKKISIPAERLSKIDADNILRDLLLSMLPPAMEAELLDKEWARETHGLSYEDRGYAEEYRNLMKQLTGLGYDINQIDALAKEVGMQLSGIEETENTRDELANDYKVLRKIKQYTDLSTDKAFTHGPKYAKAKENVQEVEVREVEREEKRPGTDQDI